MLVRWINLHEKTLDLCCLLRPLPWGASDYDWLWTNSDQQTKHEKHEKGLLESTPWLLSTHTHTRTEIIFLLFKNLNLFDQDLKDAWFLWIITTQRSAFVRWIINKYPRSLHQRFNYTYKTRNNLLTGQTNNMGRLQPFFFNLTQRATFLFDEYNACYVATASHICTHTHTHRQGLEFSFLPVFCRQQRPYNLIITGKSYRGHHFLAVYCIVNRFNSRVQLLRTKQRVLGSAGMLAAVAEPFGPPPPTHLSNIFSIFTQLWPLFFFTLVSTLFSSAFSQQHIYLLPYLG